MVGQEQGGLGIGTDGLMALDETVDGRDVGRGVTVGQRPVQQRPVAEFEAGGQPLVIIFLDVVGIPRFPDHEDVVRVAGGFVGRIAVLIPGLQEGMVRGVVVGGDAAADVLDGIQTETVDTHPDPFVRRGGQVLEAGVVREVGQVAVVQVRHPVAECAHVIEGIREIGNLDAIPTAAGEGNIPSVRRQVERLVHGKGRLSALGAIFFFPLVLPDQHPVSPVQFCDQVIGPVAVGLELKGLAILAGFPNPQLPRGRARRNLLGGLGDGQFRRTARGLLPLACTVGRALQHRELAVVGGRVGAEEIVIAVFAGRIRQRLLEPVIPLSGVVQHIVQVNVDVLGMGGSKQGFEILFGFFGRMLPNRIRRVQLVIILHIIPVVGIGRMHRRQPQGGGAQAFQVIQFVLDALEIADAVAVAVREGIDQQLVGHRAAFLLVPGLGRRGDGLRVVRLLDHGKGLGQGAGLHGQGRLPGGFTGIGLGLQFQHLVAGALRGRIAQPGVAAGYRPGRIGLDRDRLGRQRRGGKRHGLRVQGQGVLGLRCPGLLSTARQHQGAGKQQIC